MPTRSNLVNLDAMIKRADFAAHHENSFFENTTHISIRDFTSGGLIGPSLRKPDFQRETNHWSPDQVTSLLQCFVNGDLIPSVILWKSPSYLFVIDGGHRLSVLRAWVEDDYGDGPLSRQLFGPEISKAQLKAAKQTRDAINGTIGTWHHFQSRLGTDDLSPAERKAVTTVASRALPIQWVQGDADTAEASFFKINTRGTPLDDVEELLLKNRRKPISIASRAVIRAGHGHRYWSAFDADVAAEIEQAAGTLHKTLFEPELSRPVKTLDLPLGGSKGVRTALAVLIEFCLIANRNQVSEPTRLSDQGDDPTGHETVECLAKASKLARRITGNDRGSLGLHPAVYFYGPTGRHSGPMFMGTVMLFGKHLTNNNKAFFSKFTEVRSRLESLLVDYKDLIAILIQKHQGKYRNQRYCDLLEAVINRLGSDETIGESELVTMAGLSGRVVAGIVEQRGSDFSDDTRSKVFIDKALGTALTCPICNGYLDMEKSVSYDHIERKRDGGNGTSENCELTHPYCNQSVKD